MFFALSGQSISSASDSKSFLRLQGDLLFFFSKWHAILLNKTLQLLTCTYSTSTGTYTTYNNNTATYTTTISKLLFKIAELWCYGDDDDGGDDDDDDDDNDDDNDYDDEAG